MVSRGKKKTYPGSAAALVRMYALCCQLGLGLPVPSSMCGWGVQEGVKRLVNGALCVQKRATNKNECRVRSSNQRGEASSCNEQTL